MLAQHHARATGLPAAARKPMPPHRWRRLTRSLTLLVGAAALALAVHLGAAAPAVSPVGHAAPVGHPARAAAVPHRAGAARVARIDAGGRG